MLACENNLSCPSRDLVDPYLCTTLENVPIRRVIEFTGILRAGLISEKIEELRSILTFFEDQESDSEFH